MTGRKALEDNPMVLSGIMRHRDGNMENIYTALVDSETVDPGARSMLLDGQRPSSDEDFQALFPGAKAIKNMRVPFKYWIEQPCPAQRNDGDAPCLAVRRGVHEYLMETNKEYAAKQGLLDYCGYVEEGMDCLSFSIGHPQIGIESREGTVKSEPAKSWPVECIMDDGEHLLASVKMVFNSGLCDPAGIPSPWRMPMFPESGLVFHRRQFPSGDTGSDATFESSTQWFEDCITSHSRCAVGAAPDLPERVIAIGSADDPESVKLVSGGGRKARYACLSHHWEPETPCTTASNIESHQKMIPWDVLSPSFRDAIGFLRKLSRWHKEHHGDAVRYIWIDSLCILQDTNEDRKKQVGKMHDIYENAHITLSASYPPKEGRGLFSKTALYQIPKRILVKDVEGQARTLHFQSPISHPDFMEKRISPIWMRAWSLQERLLSPRLLIFGSDELSWQCSECNQCECGLDQEKTKGQLLTGSWKGPAAGLLQPTSRKMLDLVFNENASSPGQLRIVWRQILELYSGLHLTKPQDILLAIAGLAQSFNKRLGGLKYSAGIWYEQLTTSNAPNPQEETVLDLLWRLRYRRDARRDDLPMPVIDATWSWAHIQAPIIYPFVQDKLIAQYAMVVRVGGAINVPKLPEDSEEIAKQAWNHDMYTDAPPSGVTLLGRLWPTELTRITTRISAEQTGERELEYHLGEPVSGSGVKEPLEAGQILVMPPPKEGASSQERFERIPPVCFYADNLKTVVEGPVFCLAMGIFRRKPINKDLQEKCIFAGLVLEAVGHMANKEGYDPNLTKRKTDELVFRRLGLAYSTFGGWEDKHEGVLEEVPMGMVRMV